jgi:tetraacyldisaccharide 4'-kinase
MWLERHWQRVTALSVLLYPLSLLFRVAVSVRRAGYRAAILHHDRVAVPVIVVGNITVGGTGKTPLTLWLAGFLSQAGLRPGIVSRGHGGTVRHPHRVMPDDDPASFGDEPVLLARRSGCPVYIGRDRVAASRALLAAHPSCDVLVSDDGLQHYALVRDVELVVIDGERSFGNGWMLPAGPLREPRARLREADAVVVNGPARALEEIRTVFSMTLEGRLFHNLLNPEFVVGPEHFRNQRVSAFAGIGNPPRFFSHLHDLGITFEARAFADHHRFTAADVAFADADAVLMTEKDAVKCAAFASERQWALRVDAVPDPELGALVLRKLRGRSA